MRWLKVAAQLRHLYSFSQRKNKPDYIGHLLANFLFIFLAQSQRRKSNDENEKRRVEWHGYETIHMVSPGFFYMKTIENILLGPPFLWLQEIFIEHTVHPFHPHFITGTRSKIFHRFRSMWFVSKKKVLKKYSIQTCWTALVKRNSWLNLMIGTSYLCLI